ncbi:MAG TPA: hypothetical protein VNR40_19505, partial [Steroidobacter sp.]|nr:hypothetical protein [Steroidobacter sp.]
QEVTLDEMTKSRPMQAPPPASPPPSSTDSSTDAAATTTSPDPAPHVDAAAAPTEPTQPASDAPHNASGLDLQTMVSGMEPPPPPAVETPATKDVQ